MKRPTFKWPSTGRLRRTLLALGVVGAATGGLLFSAAAARAVTASGPGQLALNPPAGATSLTPTWSTTTPCPAGFQAAATLFATNADGTIGSAISPNVNSGLTAPFSGTLLGSIGSVISLGTNVTPGGTSQFVVGCFAGVGGTGAVSYVQSIFVTLDPTGANYTTKANFVVPVTTSTSVVASPNPALPGATVTLTSTTTAADGTHPAGPVQFSVGGTNIGAAVPVDANGVARTTTVFGAAGTVTVSAVFTPTNTAGYSGSTGTTTVTAPHATGSEPGHLALNPPSGATTLTPTWSSTTACPAGFQTAATLFALNTDGTVGASASPTVSTVTAPFSGTLLGPIGQIISRGTDVTAGGTSQFVVGCFAGNGGTGAVSYVQSTFVTLDSTGANYTTGVTTGTSVVASPNPAQPGATVTLTSTTTAADGTHPAGSVQFSAGGTNIGAAVPVDANGVASTTTTFAGGNELVTATFTPTNTTGYSGSTGMTTVTPPHTGVVNGSGPGQLALNPPSGATTLTPTWSTTTACPAGFQTAATLFALNTDGSIGSAISPNVNSGLTAPFSGTLLGSIGSVISLGTNVTPGGTSQFVVGCFAGNGGTGAVSYVQSTFVALDATGANYTTNTPAPSPAGATVPITFTVPPSGAFTFTVAPGTVNLAVSGAPAQGTGVLNTVTVTDTRNTFPGWSVSGQESDFAGSGTAAGKTISGNQLGWTPTGTTAPGATLGPVVAPGSPGLGTTAGILAEAHAGSGSGTSTLSANLLLAIPATAAAGPYAGTLTLTAVTVLP